MKKLVLSILLVLPLSLFAQEQTSKDSLSLVQQVEHWYDANMNYTNITLLMTVESSFIPFPSEIVIPPAAYVASKPESDLNIFYEFFNYPIFIIHILI